jgi:SAM-dependent methyltransferase
MSKNWKMVYDDLAKNNSDEISQSGYVIDGKPLEEKVFYNWFKNIQKEFKVEPIHSFVDVGCGSGIFLKFFSKYSNNLFGVDSSEYQLMSANKNYPEAKFEINNAMNFDFGGVLFDRVFCNSVFLLFDNLDYAEKVLINFEKRTKKGGKIWIGDIPEVNELVDNKYRRIGKSVDLPFQHYPESFFANFCLERNLKGRKIAQKIKGKESAKYRYDFIIEK